MLQNCFFMLQAVVLHGIGCCVTPFNGNNSAEQICNYIIATINGIKQQNLPALQVNKL